MHRRPPGRYVTVSTADEPFKAFIPAPLPPKPALVWSTPLRRRFDDALVALGRLDAITAHLPSVSLLLYSFVRKEAVLSSQIEGTQSSLADLLLYEADEIRRSQVWLGGSRPGNAAFVPPPAADVRRCMSDLERFINDEPEATPPLIKAALAHVQFETIHPFLDGNGRIGRLLIVLQLVADGVLREPMLYPSLYFKMHRPVYYDLLNEVRRQGDWERWLDFFAEGIEVSATQALATANTLLAMVSRDRDRIAELGRAAPSGLVVHRALQRHPIASSAALVEATSLTPATVKQVARASADARHCERVDEAEAWTRVQLSAVRQGTVHGDGAVAVSRWACLQREWPDVPGSPAGWASNRGTSLTSVGGRRTELIHVK